MTACASTGYWRGFWVWSERWSRRCWSSPTGSLSGCGRGAGTRSRCGVCGRRARGYDRGEGARRWRALDLGSTKAFVEAEAPRVECRRHGIVVARAAWARHGSRFTRVFEQQVAWLATHCSKSAICELMRISWPTVGRIIERVVADEQARQGRSARGADGGSGSTSSPSAKGSATSPSSSTTTPAGWSGRPRVATSRPCSPSSTSSAPSAPARIQLVSSDLGEWITRAVLERCPAATLCLDPYHVVALASSALDEVRREVWQQARRAGDTTGARWLKGARWALWKRPERLTERQQAKLATIEHVNRRLYRAYLLKEQLRLVFHSDTGGGDRAARSVARSGRAAAGSRASSSSPRRSRSTSPGSSRRSPTGSRTRGSKRSTRPYA